MITAALIALAPLLFLAALLMLELGYRLAPHLKSSGGATSAVNPVTATVLPLMGLVLAFSFSNASTRLEASRKTIVDEVNAIETAWRRADLAEPEARFQVKELLKSYTDARIRGYQVLPDRSAYQGQLELSRRLLSDSWTVAVHGTSLTPNRTLLLSALGAVSDAAGARTLSLGTHLSPPVLVFLFGVVLIGSMLVGIALAECGGRQWFYRCVVAGVLSGTVFVIMDMEYPRLALKLLWRADAMLVELRRSMV